MNMSILRKSSQITTNFIIYESAKALTRQSLAKDVCKEQMPHLARFSLRCLRLSERFSKKKVFSERMHSEVRRYLHLFAISNGRLERTSKSC